MNLDSASIAAGLSRFRKIGIIGIPPLDVIRAANEHGLVIYDLDEPLVREDLETASPFLPRVYCAILRTAVVNALHLELDAIYVDTGPGKCDCALHTATILAEALPIPVICTKNTDKTGYGTPLCQARLPLFDRMQAITGGVKSAAAYDNPPPFSAPTAGFWGVPPRDFSILELFPETTHIYGWTRCMENKTPADHALEAAFNPEVPTVFFAQSFCAKTALARYLAKKHPHALYLDVDVHTTGSARAKVQAFLELSGVGP
ncbi:MAG: hypothetical protein OEV89_07805 [Desulfobulbaceae bacterium]|nr:hypothetical protein [Desulfobulbaceae bacterium]HIJ90656.1 hypothetical protein [Deltaproteobacteria bacterium]